jgi:hypothetical protein
VCGKLLTNPVIRFGADIEQMLRAARLDVPHLGGILSDYLGPDDERVR